MSTVVTSSSPSVPGSASAAQATAVVERGDGVGSGVEVVHSSRAEPLGRFLNPARLVGLVREHRDLILQFARREVLERHHGASLGAFWNILNPLLSLAVYTFIFGVVMGVTWPEEVNHTKVPFALILFVGQTIFHIFAESVNRAPTLVTGRRSFVRKVVFPLEILSVSAVASTLVYLTVGVGIAVIATFALTGKVSTTLWLFPVVMVPLYMLSLGLSWILSSLGVFLHDIRNIVGVVTGLLMFCSGVFYPASRIPANMRWLVEYNPMYLFVEYGRRTLLWSEYPDWRKLAVMAAASFIVMQVGFAFFAKSKRGMADVI